MKSMNDVFHDLTGFERALRYAVRVKRNFAVPLNNDAQEEISKIRSIEIRMNFPTAGTGNIVTLLYARAIVCTAQACMHKCKTNVHFFVCMQLHCGAALRNDKVNYSSLD